MNDALATSPLWADIATAVLVVVGASFAAVGSFGLLRMPTFYRRIHTPTLGATLGVWSITLATIIFFSTQGYGLFLHAVLISFFVGLTAPITTIFVMRVALFRDRRKPNPKAPVPPASSAPSTAPTPPAAPATTETP